MQGRGGQAGGHCVAGKGLVRGISSTRECFPVETGAASAWHWVGRCPGSCPVSILSFSPTSGVSPEQE